jgi:hypothetical protein
MASISVRLPLERHDQDGYEMNKSVLESVKQNLKMLLLTSPGERVMLPDFGVGIRRYLFEMANQGTYDQIRTRIVLQVKRFLPFVNIIDLDIGESTLEGSSMSSGVAMSLRITYSVAGLQTADILEISTSETT